MNTFTPFKPGYFETDCGKFDSSLVRQDADEKVEIAVTSKDCITVKKGYVRSDYFTVLAFADKYGLAIDWKGFQ